MSIRTFASRFTHCALTAKHRTLTWEWDKILLVLHKDELSRALLVALVEALWDCDATVDVHWDASSITIRVMA